MPPIYDVVHDTEIPQHFAAFKWKDLYQNLKNLPKYNAEAPPGTKQTLRIKSETIKETRQARSAVNNYKNLKAVTNKGIVFRTMRQGNTLYVQRIE